MKSCPYCGRENDNVARACKECGTELSSPAPTPLTRPTYLRRAFILALAVGVVATGFFAKESVLRSVGVSGACKTAEEGVLTCSIRIPGIAPEEGVVLATDIDIARTRAEEGIIEAINRALPRAIAKKRIETPSGIRRRRIAPEEGIGVASPGYPQQPNTAAQRRADDIILAHRINHPRA